MDFQEVNDFINESEQSIDELKNKTKAMKELFSILQSIEKYGMKYLIISSDLSNDYKCCNLFDFLKEEKESVINYLKIILEYKLHKLKEEINDKLFTTNSDLLQRVRNLERDFIQ